MELTDATMETLTEQLNVTLTVLTVSPSALRYTWGINGLVVWIEDLSADNSLMQQMDDLLERIGFAVALHTGWDYRYDQGTIHPLYSYRLLLRDANHLWHAVRVNETGRLLGTVPLEELDYAVAYEKVMWVDA